MDFKEFQDHVLQHIKDYLPEEYRGVTLGIRTRDGNNGMVHTGICLHDEGKNVAPLIHLDKAFDDYQDGEALDAIMDRIAKEAVASESSRGRIDMGVDYTKFENVRDKITLHVVNGKYNQSLLGHLPHMGLPDTDLVAAYKIEVSEDEQGLMSAKVTDHMMEIWGIHKEVLHEMALENTARMHPFCIQDMEGMLYGDTAVPGVYPEQMGGDGFFVLTTDNKIGGAATILYPGLLKEIGERFGGDYFILPSSLHELILVKDTGEFSAENMQHMVDDINHTQVPPEDVLSNQVYRYDRADDRFYMATDPEKTRDFRVEDSQWEEDAWPWDGLIPDNGMER